VLMLLALNLLTAGVAPGRRAGNNFTKRGGK
jgi:hypothetical protein